MKNISTIIIVFALSTSAFSQNTFPPNGNVGIATSSPQATLDVGGLLTSPFLTSPVALFSKNINSTTGVESTNIHAGSNAEFRYSISDNNGASIFMSMPGINNSSSALFGKARNTVSLLYNTSRDLAVGTFHNNNLVLGTNNAARMTISGGGRIGIGTSIPNNIVHVKTTANGGGISIQRSSATNGSYADIGWVLSPVDSIAQSSYIRTYRRSAIDDNDMVFNVGGNNAMSILDNGNIGIGTTSPISKMHVEGTVASGIVNSALFGNTDGSNGATARIYLSGNNQTTRSAYMEGINVEANNGNEHALAFGTSGPSSNPVERMRIDQNGNVGIGTTDSKGYKLAVNGNIRTKEVRVEIVNWPDYVFKPSYSLPNLAEVKRYIYTKGHLPGIPSAQETEQNGIELGEMNKLLLKKLEELTLYLIRKDEELEAQQKINLANQEQINQLKKQISFIAEQINCK